MDSSIWMLVQVLLILQVLLEVAKSLCVEKFKNLLVEQLKEAVHRREVFYVTCYAWVGCEAMGRATTVAAATATGGGATRTGGRGVAITSVCGGGAACCCANCGAAGICSQLFEDRSVDNERKNCTHLLEMKAVQLALWTFVSKKSDIHVLLLINNSTTIAYINHNQRCPIWHWKFGIGV